MKTYLLKSACVAILFPIRLLLLTLFFFIGNTVYCQEQYATGATPPTVEDLKWMDENMINTDHVYLNHIGLERVNKHRRQNGLAELDNSSIVKLGNEVVGKSKAESGMQIQKSTRTILPIAVDNSTLDCFPPIRSQGSIGSCSAFASTYYAMTHMTGLLRNWNTKNDNDNSNKFSPKWSHNMKSDCATRLSGISLLSIYPLLLKHGAALWSEFPYDGNPNNPLNYREWCMNPDTWHNAIHYRMNQAGYINYVASDEGITNLKTLLTDGYVLNFSTYWTWKYLRIKDNPLATEDDAYVGKKVCYIVDDPDPNTGHSVTIVGYNDSLWIDIDDDYVIDENELGAFRIANSHGTWDGDGGYHWLSYAAIQKNYGSLSSTPYWDYAIWDSRVYWITARESYTPKLIAKFTLNSATRNNIGVILGTSPTSWSQPEMEWGSEAINCCGGAFAFDGTSTACDGTFVFDYSDLIFFQTPATKRWWLKTVDYIVGNPTTTKYFALLDGYNGSPISEETFLATVDASYQGFQIVPGIIKASLDLTYSPQPDALISTDEEMLTFIGDNIYNVIETQTSSQQVATMPTYYKVRVYNDGNISDHFSVTAPASEANWTFNYFNENNEDITNDVIGDGYKIWLLPNSYIECKVAVSASASVPLGTVNELLLTATSSNDETKTDTVRMALSKVAALSSASLSAAPSSYSPVGDTVTFTTTVTGGAKVEYKYRVAYKSDGTWLWTTIRDYSRSNTCNWTPTEARKYCIAVWVREVGSTSAYDVYDSMYYYTVLDGVDLVVTPTSPRPAGTCISLTAIPIPGDVVGEVEYFFKVGYDTGGGVYSWTTIQDYSPSTACTWTPTIPKLYCVVLYARKKERSVSYDVYDSAWYNIQ